MNNILIPTVYESDTNHALRIALDVRHNADTEIVLMSISQISDSIMDLLFLSPEDAIDKKKRDEVLNVWRGEVPTEVASKLKVQHQYGLTGPLAKQILSRYDIGMVIVPQSFRNSKLYVHQHALQLFQKFGCPIMHLPAGDISYKGIQRALYLDDTKQDSAIPVQQFPFHVIHKSMLKQGESIQAIVDRMQIDLIVRDKKGAVSNDRSQMDATEIGLPVLTI